MNREDLAESIDKLPEDQWTDNGTMSGDEVWYPALLQFGKEMLYDPISWVLHETGLSDEDLLDMTEAEAEKQLKIIFGINKHEVNQVAQLTVGVDQATARREIKNYLTKRG